MSRGPGRSSAGPVIKSSTPETTLSLIDEQEKINELGGLFHYLEHGRRIIRDLTEIHEVEWRRPDKKPQTVHVKYLRYATVMESDIHLTIEEKKKALKSVLSDMINWTSLKHQNIIDFIGYQWKDKPLLVFWWYKNGNIAQYLDHNKGVDGLNLLAGTAQGLSFLHFKAIVHGDIKSSNVIIADDGRPMLMDFGMTPDIKRVERDLTIADGGRQDVGFMSPEVIEQGLYTKASDVYAFGGLILEVMSGQPPFHGLPYIQAMMQITQGAQPRPEDHPKLMESSSLWPLMRDCWKAAPKERPSIEEVQNVLKPQPKSQLGGLFGTVASFVVRLIRLQR